MRDIWRIELQDLVIIFWGREEKRVLAEKTHRVTRCLSNYEALPGFPPWKWEGQDHSLFQRCVVIHGILTWFSELSQGVKHAGRLSRRGRSGAGSG